MSDQKKNPLFEEAQQYIPGGVNSPVRAFRAVGMDPPFSARGESSRSYDTDGNSYSDYVMSWGPNLLGHGDARILSAVRDAVGNGLTFGAPTTRETELAKLICECHPAIEKVRLVSSGTEACMSAIRLARGVTGKDKIIKFRGNYHGHSDGLLVKAGSGLLTESVPDSAGVPKGYAENTLLADYNSEASVEALFRANDDIAAIIVEPVAANMGVVPPKDGFLSFLRTICTERGALLIGPGASEYYGVTPDLVTLGKVVGGGMPLAAYGGRAELMDFIAPTGPVYQAGTLSGNPVATAAGLAQLTVLKEHPDLYGRLEEKAQVLETAYREKGWNVNRAGSLLSVFFTDRPVENYDDALTCDTDLFARYFRHMLGRGIYLAPSQFEAIFVSAVHTADDLEQTVDAIRAFRE